MGAETRPCLDVDDDDDDDDDDAGGGGGGGGGGHGIHKNWCQLQPL